MAIFNSYVKLPEGTNSSQLVQDFATIHRTAHSKIAGKSRRRHGWDATRYLLNGIRNSKSWALFWNLLGLHMQFAMRSPPKKKRKGALPVAPQQD